MVMTGVNLCLSWCGRFLHSPILGHRAFCRRGLGFLHLPDFLFSALGSPIYLLCTVQDKFLGGDGYDPHHAKFLQSVSDDEEEE